MKNNLMLGFVVIALFCLLAGAIYGLISLRSENIKLNGYAKILEKNIISLQATLRRYQDKAMSIDKAGEEALSYMKWRFVLKDQVEQARQRLTAKTAEINNLKKDGAEAALIYYNLGLSSVLASDFDSAIKAFEEAVNLNPRDADSFYDLGLLYSAYRKATNKAIEYYKKYLELVPKGTKSDEVRERIKDLSK